MLFQLCCYEGVEIIAVKKGLGTLGKVLLVVARPVVAHLFAVVQQDLFVDTRRHGFVVSIDDALIFEA